MATSSNPPNTLEQVLIIAALALVGTGVVACPRSPVSAAGATNQRGVAMERRIAEQTILNNAPEYRRQAELRRQKGLPPDPNLEQALEIIRAHDAQTPPPEGAAPAR